MAAWLEIVTGWVGSHRELVWGVSIASVLMFLGTLIVVPLLLTRMPADYFLHDPGDRSDGWDGWHPAVRLTARFLKNLVGAIFVVSGIGMLVLPGQGILTILLGVALLDLPGKRRLEIALLRRPHVRRGVDWLRTRAHRPPLELPRKV